MVLRCARHPNGSEALFVATMPYALQGGTQGWIQANLSNYSVKHARERFWKGLRVEAEQAESSVEKDGAGGVHIVPDCSRRPCADASSASSPRPVRNAEREYAFEDDRVYWAEQQHICEPVHASTCAHAWIHACALHACICSLLCVQTGCAERAGAIVRASTRRHT
eukprot:6195586-Pleurochrysis_carterae.AAC.4